MGLNILDRITLLNKERFAIRNIVIIRKYDPVGYHIILRNYMLKSQLHELHVLRLSELCTLNTLSNTLKYT
jgi:hypothetical protein